AAGGYDIVLLNPVNSMQGSLAGATASGTTTITITSGPGSYNYSFPTYYESAQTTINGESLTINPSIKLGGPVQNVAATATMGLTRKEIGRASCRERGEEWVVSEAVKVNNDKVQQKWE